LTGGSRFCNMCGSKVEAGLDSKQDSYASDKRLLAEKKIKTAYGEKTIKVLCEDITHYEGEIGILTISASANSFKPVSGTVIEALEKLKGIVTSQIADNAYLRITGQANCFVSYRLKNDSDNPNIHRLGCVQRSSYEIRKENGDSDEDSILKSLKAYYKMLDFMAELGEEIGTIVMPILGSGSLGMDNRLISYPLVNEAIEALKRNPAITEIIFVEREHRKAELLAECLEQSYQILSDKMLEDNVSPEKSKPYVFISYSTEGDYEIAQKMCNLLTEKGIDSWFAPNDIKHGDYASKIVEGIERCTHFICIVSKYSLNSSHVLNEIDLAFQHVREGVEILPFRLDDDELNSSFKYYLSRMQWNYGNPPPVENRISEFIDKVFF